MATKKKMLQAAAGQAGGAALDITDVFSTYLYPSSNEVDKPVVNNIDLSTEGGLVWIKTRSVSNNHYLYDTVRGSSVGNDKSLKSNSTAAESSGANLDYLQFNSDGFTAKHVTGGGALGTNTYYGDMASWTFRKAPKFFDVVTYTGDGTNGRQISHNLGHDVGMMLIKRTNSSDDWRVFHRSQSNKYAALNSTFQFQTDGGNIFGNPSNGTATAPTSTHFTVANDASVNGNGSTYVAYLFAHNDGDGEFGPDADQDIIKCGSFTEGASGASIDLGFEPQFLLFKRSSGTSEWYIVDAMRGMPVGGTDVVLNANSSAAEGTIGDSIDLTPTGFNVNPLFGNTQTSIYIAIRRGPLAQPESGTDVFAPNLASGYPRYPSGFTTDFVIQKNRSSGSSAAYSRLQGNDNLNPTSTAQESASAWDWAQMTGSGTNFTSTGYIGWSWKRAPGFCDVVAYKGDAVAGRTVSHNLGVAPEMMVFKNRDTSGTNWDTYHKDLGPNGFVSLNLENAYISNINRFNNTNPTDTEFTLGTAIRVNGSGDSLIAYLFASLPGISKVGSYTGTGQTGGDINVDCGFTSGARFVMIKRTDASGSWWVADTARGIVSGNEPLLALNDTSAELTGYNMVEPYSSGFIVNGSGGGDNSWNDAGGNYIFYAIA